MESQRWSVYNYIYIGTFLLPMFWVHIWTGLEFFTKFKSSQKSVIFFLTSFIIPFKNLVYLVLNEYSVAALGIFTMYAYIKLHFLLSAVIREWTIHAYVIPDNWTLPCIINIPQNVETILDGDISTILYMSSPF